MGEGKVPAMWLQGELLGGHVHIKVFTGEMFDRPLADPSKGGHNSGKAGDLIVREHEWLPFVKALALGGAQTGMRVVWRCEGLDGRFLWNGLLCDPCIIGTQEPVAWEVVRDGGAESAVDA